MVGEDVIYELAARLGSIVIFERHGDVVFLEDFAHGINRWDTVTLGTGADVSQSPDRFMSVGYSAKITTPSDALLRVAMNRYVPYPFLSKMGVELGISFQSVFDYLVLKLGIYDGTARYQGEIRYYYTDAVLKLVDENGDEQTLGTGLDLLSGLNTFNVFKLVCDFEGNDYVRLLVNEKSYDLVTYPLKADASAATPRVVVQLMLYGLAAQNDYVYVDNVIVTQNEPASD